MFTGIIEELGIVQNITSNKITIECGIVIQDAKLGDSIAVNGVCLTVVDLTPNSFTADKEYNTVNTTAEAIMSRSNNYIIQLSYQIFFNELLVAEQDLLTA